MPQFSLAERLRGLERLCLPVWVFDVERARMAWGNAAALTIWRSPSLDEFLSRDYSDASTATRTRNEGFLRRLREGHDAHIEHAFTFYPRGEPLHLRCFISGIELDDGRFAQLIEGQVRTEAQDPRILRCDEALRHVSAMVALLSPEGAVLVRNPAAENAFGGSSTPSAWFEDAGAEARILKVAETQEVLDEELVALTSEGPRWHAVEARRTSDPVTGKHAIVVHQVDVTERREREALIEAQQREILELSAPLLDVAEGVVAVPIIAALTEARCAELERRLLPGLVERGARVVVFDLTGATASEGEGLSQLVRLINAVRLLGARPMVTGVRSTLARELVQSGADLAGAAVMRSLRDALASPRAARR
ncbi:STAS domain-containing protein [Polyangium sorediatum]|uniref:PAS domain-containing protein n=1 Tax=Polyangium sorediatum TaxID=889274 RepID=A0ABT6P599_9BACT|nr:STAS domain-containing protein [Polyangium sorediatum]MDI1435728.1 PAS domain-containing protein [Polyangium sorediatum]